METYPRAAVERAMKIQEVILRAVAKKITWVQPVEIIGLCERQMRMWSAFLHDQRARRLPRTHRDSNPQRRVERSSPPSLSWLRQECTRPSRLNPLKVVRSPEG